MAINRVSLVLTMAVAGLVWGIDTGGTIGVEMLSGPLNPSTARDGITSELAFSGSPSGAPIDSCHTDKEGSASLEAKETTRPTANMARALVRAQATREARRIRP